MTEPIRQVRVLPGAEPVQVEKLSVLGLMREFSKALGIPLEDVIRARVGDLDLHGQKGTTVTIEYWVPWTTE